MTTGAFDHGVCIDHAAVQFITPHLDPREIEQVVDETQHITPAFMDVTGVFLVFLVAKRPENLLA